MNGDEYGRFRQIPLVPDEYFETFVVRLARENRWTRVHAERVVEEYRRFLFLVRTTELAVTPSDAVDQVWHLHLTDTVSYDQFCEKAFGRWLDHVPSRGGVAQADLMLGRERRASGQRRRILSPRAFKTPERTRR